MLHNRFQQLRKVLLNSVFLLFFLFLLFKLVIEIFPSAGGAKHDEIQHLRIIFGMLEGVFPHKDFVDNHPVFLHILFAKLIQFFNFTNPNNAYFFLKSLFILHVFGTLVIIHFIVKEILAPQRSLFFSLCLYSAVLGSLNLWERSAAWIWGVHSIWQFRMDWFSYFYGMAAVLFFLKSMRAQGSPFCGSSIFAGFLFAVSMAIIPKMIFIILPLLVLGIVVGIKLYSEGLSPVGLVKSRVRAVMIFCATVVFVYSFCISLETRFIDLNFFDYFKYVFEINNNRHPLVLNFGNDFSGTSILKSIFGLNILSFCFLLVMIVFVFRNFILGKENKNFYLMLLSALVVLFNCFIPSFTNGVIWPWYFIPTILASCIAVEAIVTSFGLAGLKNVLFCLASVLVANEYYRTLLHLNEENIFRCLVNDNCADRNLKSELPKDYRVFTITLDNLPVEAKVVNYYLFGFVDYKLWTDYHKMGVGPEIQEDIDKGIASLPEVLNFSGKKDFRYRSWVMELANSIDLYKHLQTLEEKYNCLSNVNRSYFFRKDKVSHLKSLGWSECPNKFPEKK